VGHLDKIVDIDQSPIGRTPRSNPATYTGAFSPIRDWFSQLPESTERGYKPGRFSFNVKGGRLIAEGPPEEIVKVAESYTGQYLARHLPRSAAAKKRA
jgi:excinuclease UvrABC ATPase subunit